MNSLVKRTITGLLLVAIIVAAILIAPITFLIVSCLIGGLSLYEFYKMIQSQGKYPHTIYGIVTGTFLIISSYVYVYNIVDEAIFLFFIPLFTGNFIFEIYRKTNYPLANIAYTFFAVLYISGPFFLLNFLILYNKHYESKLILIFFVLVWIFDTSTYLIGRIFGRNHIFPRISPKKTWEGFIGGAVITLVVSMFLPGFCSLLSLAQSGIIALLIILGATYGDFLMSLFKRQLQIKDTGTILPGHGGFLDRFDSVFVAFPLVFFYIYFIL